jgi:hypothetical protein
MDSFRRFEWFGQPTTGWQCVVQAQEIQLRINADETNPETAPRFRRLSQHKTKMTSRMTGHLLRVTAKKWRSRRDSNPRPPT